MKSNLILNFGEKNKEIKIKNKYYSATLDLKSISWNEFKQTFSDTESKKEISGVLVNEREIKDLKDLDFFEDLDLVVKGIVGSRENFEEFELEDWDFINNDSGSEFEEYLENNQWPNMIREDLKNVVRDLGQLDRVEEMDFGKVQKSDVQLNNHKETGNPQQKHMNESTDELGRYQNDPEKDILVSRMESMFSQMMSINPDDEFDELDNFEKTLNSLKEIRGF